MEANKRKDLSRTSVEHRNYCPSQHVGILVNDKIAVEVERGKSDIIENVKKNRQAGLDSHHSDHK